MDNIFVSSEWGELKECIYGAPNDLVFAKWLLDADCRPWGEFRTLWKENQGKSLKKVDPERFERFQSQDSRR